MLLTVDKPSRAEPRREPAMGELTRAPRARVMLSATLERFGGGAPTKHHVRDLSPGGIRIDQADGMTTSASVLISVGVLEAVGATVKWVVDGCAGLAFAEQIDPEQARMRAAIAPRGAARPADVRSAAPAPGSGWVDAMRNP